MVRNLRVASVQMESVPGDKSANLAKVREFVARAAGERAQLVLFPECCLTGYWWLRKLDREQFAAQAEPVPGPCTRELLAMSREFGLTLGAGLIELTPEGECYNCFVVAMPDGQFRRHRKLHAFVSQHLKCGSEFTVFDTPHGCRVGVLTCYDNNLVENVRITALLGAEVLLAPHQTGGCVTASPHAMGLIDRRLWDDRHKDPEAIEAEFRGEKGRGWLMRWLPSRAHDNGMFLVFSNGVGVDDNEIRTGNAMILDPYGRVLVETWKADDDMVIADLKASLRGKSTGERWIRTRRPELYGLLAQRTGKEEETRKVRFEE